MDIAYDNVFLLTELNYILNLAHVPELKNQNRQKQIQNYENFIVVVLY